MAVRLFQVDIFGGKSEVSCCSPTAPASPSKKYDFRDISIEDGNDELYVSSEYIVILRRIQKKIVWGVENKKKRILLKTIMDDEMNIKLGLIDPISSVRNALIKYLCNK
jgi:hypothetical protein